MRRRLLSCLFVGAAFGGGCAGDSAGPTPERGLTIETDKPVYSLAADSTARVTLTNRSGARIYMPMGSYLGYERLVGAEWGEPFAWFTIDGIGRSVSMPAGAVRTDQLEIWYYLADQPGTYRFSYWLYADDALRLPLPLEERVSLPFTVTP
jgi:hypothetical protein